MPFQPLPPPPAFSLPDADWDLLRRLPPQALEGLVSEKARTQDMPWLLAMESMGLFKVGLHREFTPYERFQGKSSFPLHTALRSVLDGVRCPPRVLGTPVSHPVSLDLNPEFRNFFERVTGPVSGVFPDNADDTKAHQNLLHLACAIDAPVTLGRFLRHGSPMAFAPAFCMGPASRALPFHDFSMDQVEVTPVVTAAIHGSTRCLDVLYAQANVQRHAVHVRGNAACARKPRFSEGNPNKESIQKTHASALSLMDVVVSCGSAMKPEALAKTIAHEKTANGFADHDKEALLAFVISTMTNRILEPHEQRVWEVLEASGAVDAWPGRVLPYAAGNDQRDVMARFCRLTKQDWDQALASGDSTDFIANVVNMATYAKMDGKAIDRLPTALALIDMLDRDGRLMDVLKRPDLGQKLIAYAFDPDHAKALHRLLQAGVGHDTTLFNGEVAETHAHRMNRPEAAAVMRSFAALAQTHRLLDGLLHESQPKAEIAP